MSTKGHLGLTAACVAVILSACVPEPADVQGEGVEHLYTIFFIVAAVVFTLVAGLITWSLVRYRAKPGDDLPKQFDRNLKLELTWFAIPLITVVVLFILSAGVLGKVNAESADPSVTVNVEGYQWGWRFTYEGSGVQIVGDADDRPEIVLPVGRPLTFTLGSADVVHSFWVPRFLIKRDMVPGRQNTISLTISDPGVYRGVCTEFCGLLHAKMNFVIRAIPPAQFEGWLDGQRTTDGDG
ncbi:MAG: cytochrome c oxidase subunit II [Actinobacteria bacterium]|nr:cytochrome c oxidase subunit II [Actinomycetota bacterium]